MGLDTAGPTALHLQLRELLLHKIESGELPPDTRLPSARELSEEFGVSRMTVRRAMDALLQQGRIHTVVGKGTYVARPKIQQQLQVLASFTEDMRNRNMTASARVLVADLIPATPALASILNIREGVEIARLERLRTADGLPMALEMAHLPHHLCPGILRHDLATLSLYEILRNEYDLKLARATQVLEATAPNKREAELLQMPSRTPVLLIERTTFLSSGEIIEFVKSAYRGDKYRFSVALAGEGQVRDR